MFMADFELGFPRDGFLVRTSHPARNGAPASWFFVSSGTRDESIVEVTGTCTGEKCQVNGIRVPFPDNDETANRWSLYFRIPEDAAGTYELEVVGIDKQGERHRQTRKVSVGRAEGEKLATPPTSTIAWPSDGEDITAYTNDFEPYGDLGAAIDILTLKYPPPSYGNTVNRLGYFEDFTTNYYWVGQFSTLPGGQTFELRLKDNSGTDIRVHPYTT
jgi:hypothetical protein